MKLRALLVAVLCSSFALGAVARADVLDTPLPAPVWTKTIGTMRVQRYGVGSPALILIPDLSAGPWAFVDTIARRAKAHAVYALTPAGFDGVPAASNNTLDALDISLSQLIAGEKLERPILIGHGLGGLLALRYGIEHPSALRAIVSIDGTPVFPSEQAATASQRATAGENYYSAVDTAPTATYQVDETQTVDDYVTDQTLAAHVATLMLRSDQTAVASYGRDQYRTDLRPNLAKLTVPALVMVPVPGPPLPSYYPESMASMTAGQRRVSTLGFYKMLFDRAPASLTLVPIEDSRHFVMLDQPDAFASALDTFLAGVH